MHSTYIIYVDVFFMVNFIMDYLVLYLTSKVMRKKSNTIRMISGAGFGAIYSVVVLIPLINHLPIVTFLSIITAFLMTLIAFGYQNKSEYFKNVAFLGCVTFLLSGIMNYLYYSTELGVLVQNLLKGTSNKAINTRKFIFVTTLSYLVMVLVIKFIKAQKRDAELIFDIKLSFKGKSVVAKGLLDTGNTLKEPISGKIVHIAEYRIIKPMIEGDENAEEKICVIPYHSVGEENGILYGYRLDEMVVLINDEPKFLYNPIIAVYEGKLSTKNKFTVILNAETLES